MIKAIKVRIYPTQEQMIHLNQSFGSSRWVYNTLLAKQKDSYNEEKRKLNVSELGKYLTALKPQYPWLANVSAGMLQQSMLNLNQGYSNFFKNMKHFSLPVFKSKHSKQRIKFPKDTVRKCKGNRINLTKKLENIHFKCSKKDEKYLNKNFDLIKSVTISKNKSGKLFASFLVERPNLKQLPASNYIIGLDLGIKDFIIASDGTSFKNIKSNRSNKNKLKTLHQSLSRKKKGSNNKNKARIKLAKFNEKINNKKEFYLHSIVNQLLNENQVIAIEDLNVKGMMKNHNLAKSIQELSINRFISILKYKAKWYGRKVEKVDRFFPSSKLCSSCSSVNKSLTLKDREWKCGPCGTTHDRDLNAAINIEQEIKRKIGLNSPELTLQESSKILRSLNEEKNVYMKLHKLS